MLRIWRFISLLLAALGLTFGAAHALELPPKMQYSAELYATVTSTLYLFFGIAGAIVQVSAIIASIVLSVLARHCRTFQLTLFGALFLALSLVLWAVIVQPVNTEWSRIMASGSESIPAAYLRLRSRWEYGHVAAFCAWFMGFSLLTLSVVLETPAEDARNRQ